MLIYEDVQALTIFICLYISTMYYELLEVRDQELVISESLESGIPAAHKVYT